MERHESRKVLYLEQERGGDKAREGNGGVQMSYGNPPHTPGVHTTEKNMDTSGVHSTEKHMDSSSSLPAVSRRQV